jgi:AraC family transcriptional regulator
MSRNRTRRFATSCCTETVPAGLIVPDQLPIWVPGQLTVRSQDREWEGVSVRGYRYGGSDVPVPPMRDYMIVAYRRGSTAMYRRIDHGWSTEHLGPGDVSLLTRAAESHWRWPAGIEVVHVYLTQDELASVCQDMYHREVREVELHDVLKADDPAIHRAAMALAAEAARSQAGSRILVDSLACEIAVHILRRHANISFAGQAADCPLSDAQLRQVRDYVDDHLAESISLQDLASTVAVSRHHFARQFRIATGTTPHEFVLAQRVTRARRLLRRTLLPLREIATECGFADQSHMTRVFRQRLGTTPGEYRRG